MRKIGYNAVFKARIAYSADFSSPKSRVLSDIYCIVAMVSTADLPCIQCHVNPMALHAQNQNNPIVHLFVGRGYDIHKLNAKKSLPHPPLLLRSNRKSTVRAQYVRKKGDARWQRPKTATARQGSTNRPPSQYGATPSF